MQIISLARTWVSERWPRSPCTLACAPVTVPQALEFWMMACEQRARSSSHIFHLISFMSWWFPQSQSIFVNVKVSTVNVLRSVEWFSLVLATGPRNPPAVRVWTGKTVGFGSWTVQKPDPQLLVGPNPNPYPSTRGFCRVWLDPSVPISGSSFRVCLFMVTFRYPPVLCKILTLVHHCLCSIYWLPMKSKQAETRSLLHHEVECERFFFLHH